MQPTNQTPENRLIQWVRLWHYRFSLWRYNHFQRWRIISWSVFLVVFVGGGLNTAALLLKPNRIAPLTTVNGKTYFLANKPKVIEILTNDFNNQQITVNYNSKSVPLKLSEAGFELRANKTVSESSLPPMKGIDKIPLIGSLRHLSVSVSPQYNVDRQKLSESLKNIIPNERVDPINATVKLQDKVANGFVIENHKDGYEISPTFAAEQVAEAVIRQQFSVVVQPVDLQPQWTTQDVSAFAPKVTEAYERSLTIISGNKRLLIPSSDIASLLNIDYDEANLFVSLQIDKLTAYLDKRAADLYIEPGVTQVVIENAQEVSRQVGAEGSTLDSTSTAIAAADAFRRGDSTVNAIMQTLPSNIKTVNNYTNNDEGLLELIQNFVSVRRGKFRIAIVELDGPGNRSAFYNAEELVVPASTYKLFIAYGILQKIASGELDMDSPTDEGSVSFCFTWMITYSTNPCAIAFQNILGWQSFDKQLKADGFSQTKLDNSGGGNKYTSARDEMLLLSKLYHQELLPTGQNDFILDMLKNQIYRDGIPEGSSGSVVANKIGFLGSITNDIGIVYGPKSTYALVALTDGAGGFPTIKLLAEQVYEYFMQ